VANKKKISFKIKKLTKTAFSYAGYIPLRIVEQKTSAGIIQKSFLQRLLRRPASKLPDRKSYKIYAGPIRGNDTQMLELLPGIDGAAMDPKWRKLIEEKHEPNPQLTVFDQSTKSALTAAEADEKRAASNRWVPMYYQNPMQGYDYIVYESMIKNSVLGPVMRTLIKFIMGTGFRPELELLIPTNCKKDDAKVVADNEEIVSRLLQVDRAVTEKSGVEGIDISFKTKMTNMIQNMLIFNRSCGVFIYDKENPVVIDGKKFPKIPINIVDFHPRDIGIVKISPDSHKMIAVQINQISGFVNTEEMIYFWNSDYAAPIWNAKYYGGSLMMPMIDPARVIRSTVSSIIPAINENMVGGLYHIFIEPQGGTEQQKKDEYTSITEATDYATSNVFMISPDRVKYENVNFDPKIQELIEMFNMLVKYVLALANVPQIGFYDEAAANHATAVEKIQLTISTVINPMRDWIGGEIANQWYNRIFKQLYGDDSKERKLFRIKVAFDDLQVETLKERAEALEVLERRAPLTHEKAEEILQIDGYQDSIDEDRETVPAREEFDVKNEQTKENFKVKSRAPSAPRS